MKDNDAATKWAVDYLESHELQTDSHSIVIKKTHLKVFSF